MLSTNADARGFDMQGFISYDIPNFSPRPSNYVSSKGGVGYSFFGRMELGPGMIETGFLYAPFSLTTLNNQEFKFSGSYWTFPLLYRYEFWEPYLSLAAGFDYAVEGGTQINVNGASAGASNLSYQSHFGAVLSFQAKQDLGEDLSVVLDLRYRMGLGSAIDAPNGVTSTATKLNFTSIGIGISKHLEE